MTAAPTTAVVVTTINDGQFLDHYRTLLADEELRDRVRLIVIPDRKTPASLFRTVDAMARDGFDIACPDLERQTKLLDRWGAPEFFVPVDSDNRRNLGYAIAWADGHDVIVSIDDDNIPLSPEFFDEHGVVDQDAVSTTSVSSSTGWFNCCEMLLCEPNGIYPRGFPYNKRTPAVVETQEVTVPVAINAGLWLGDPDVDALTRIVLSPEVLQPASDPLVLAADTYCPVNSQNTAVRHAAIAAYYFPRMGNVVDGLTFDRFGDIFSGVFVQACAKHLGHAVRFGGPYVRHDRNEHDLLADLRSELPGIALMDDLSDWLCDAELDGSTYAEAYSSLSYLLDEAVEGFRGRPWTPAARGFFHQMTYAMRTWLGILDHAADD